MMRYEGKNINFMQEAPLWSVVVFTLAVCSFFIFPLSHGWFWIIDDHELIAYASEFSKRSESFFSVFVAELSKTEVGDHHNSILRYRPVYYSLRILQAALFGLNPGPYFVVNLLLLGGGLFFFGLTLRRFFPWPVLLAAMGMAAGLGYNHDLWARLGPSERDCFFYLMLFLWGFVWQDKSWAWPVCCVAAALAIGSKENFLLLFLPLGVLFYKQARQKRYLSLAWVIFPLSVAFPVIYIVLRTILAGHDTYAQDSSHTHILRSVCVFLKTKMGLISCGIFCVSIVLYVLRKDEKNKAVLFYLLICLILIWGNFVFYRGNIGFYGRYGFPYYFLGFIACLIILYQFSYQFKAFFQKCYIAVLAILYAGIFLLLISTNTAMNHQISVTQNFYNIVSESKGFERLILINGGQATQSYEPYLSLRRFSSAGFIPPIGYFPLFAIPDDAFQQSLQGTLENASKAQGEILLRSDVYLISFENKRLFAVEHSSDFRRALNTVTSRPVKHDGEGNALIDGDVSFFLPYDEAVGLSGIKVYGSWRDAQDMAFIVNGQSVTAAPYEDDTTFLLPLSSQALASARHPQLLELGIQVNPFLKEGKGRLLEISAFELIRQPGLAPGNGKILER